MYNYDKYTSLQLLPLGKHTKYRDTYDSSLLQTVSRFINRDILGMSKTSSLPFHGYDIWTLYELSWLNEQGLPQVAVGEVKIDAGSLNIIESKSFKLYLNSFNQTIFSSLEAVQDTILRDLTNCAQGEVQVSIRRLSEVVCSPIIDLEGVCIDEQPIAITDYHLGNQLLKGATNDKLLNETLVSNLLKSNCLITHQPDWGSIQIKYYGPGINHEALLKYIVSFRQHYEFHEQCVERIFTDIMHFCSPKELSVYARYTRRGGLDINPWRSNTNFTPIIGRLARQ